MPTLQEIFEKLRQPFPAKDLKYRVGNTFDNGSRGQLFVYVDARTIQDRLDEIIGCNNWQVSYQIFENTGVICNLELNLQNEDHSFSRVSKQDGAGFRSLNGNDKNDLKSTISDAFKRAAVAFGVGRYFYEIDPIYVNLVNRQFKGEIVLPDKFLPEDERVGNNEVRIAYHSTQPAQYQPQNHSNNPNSQPPVEISDAMNFIIQTGFSVGRKMSDVSEKSLGWLVGNAATVDEQNAAKAVLNFKKGNIQ